MKLWHINVFCIFFSFLLAIFCLFSGNLFAFYLNLFASLSNAIVVYINISK